LILDLLGNNILSLDGQRSTPRQELPLEYTVGKRWSTTFRSERGGVDLGITVLDFKITARERITVPAGTFDCFRVEGVKMDEDMLRQPQRIENRMTYWHAPAQVRRPVAFEVVRWRGRPSDMKLVHSERRELLSFKQS